MGFTQRLVIALGLSVLSHTASADLYFHTPKCTDPTDEITEHLCIVAQSLNVSVESAYTGSTLSSIEHHAQHCRFELTPEYVAQRDALLKKTGVRKVYDFNFEMTEHFDGKYFVVPRTSDCQQRYRQGGPLQPNDPPDRPVVYR